MATGVRLAIRAVATPSEGSGAARAGRSGEMIRATRPEELGQVSVPRQGHLLAAGAVLARGLTDALDGLLTYLGDGPTLISGDVDSSLLAVADDLKSEDSLLSRRSRR